MTDYIWASNKFKLQRALAGADHAMDEATIKERYIALGGKVVEKDTDGGSMTISKGIEEDIKTIEEVTKQIEEEPKVEEREKPKRGRKKKNVD